MLVGILSDTHDRLDITRRAIETLRAARVEVLVHCGDLTTPEVVQLCNVLPTYFSLGNHDADRADELETVIQASGGACLRDGGIVEIGGKQIAITHGHVGMKDLLAAAPDYLLHGHSHIAADELIGTTRRICPGALHRSEDPSVATLDTDTGEVQILRLTI